MTELSYDELRRQLRDAQVAQREAMPAYRELLNRLFGGDDVAGVDQASILGPLTRRSAVRIAGISVASAAILAACGKKKVTAPGQIPQNGDPNTIDKPPAAVIDNIVLLRTASSLEYVAIDVYDTAIKSGLVTTAAIGDAAKLFREQHAEHAALFEAATRQLGGEAFSEHNPIVWKAVVEPTVPNLKSEADVVIFAHTLETVAAATYQSTVGLFTAPKLRQAAMSVGGVEARHAAVLAGVIKALDAIPGSGITPIASAAAPATTVAGTTTVAAGPTTIPAKVPDPVFQVPAPFGTVSGALGPNTFMYYEKPAATTTTTKAP